MITKFVRLEILTSDDGSRCSLNCDLMYSDPENGLYCPIAGEVKYDGVNNPKRPDKCKEAELP